MSPADRDLYEKLGLSETEWAKVLEAKMPLSKVHELLASGISISEYFRRPWQSLTISEDEYIRLRRAGYSDDEVRFMRQRKQSPNEWPVAQSFFSPGFNQVKRGRPVRGWVMTGIAAGCIGLFAAQTIQTRRFQPLGLFLLIPDMAWSGVDICIQVYRERRRDSLQTRFLCAGSGMSVSFSFH